MVTLADKSGYTRSRRDLELYIFPLYLTAHKTEYMCFNQTGDISTLDGTSLKLVDKFTYLGSSVSSTEKDINTRLTKTRTAIDHMEVKPDR